MTRNEMRKKKTRAFLNLHTLLLLYIQSLELISKKKKVKGSSKNLLGDSG